jgi:GNAT superfamily N-acetyltransferase
MLNALLEPFYLHRKYTIYAVDLSNAKCHNGANCSWEFKLITSNDKNDIRQIEEIAEWMKDKLVEKLNNGGLCLAARSNQQVIGFNLIAFGRVYIPLLMIEKTFGLQEAWSEQITVHKDHRKKGLASELRYRIFDVLKKRGVKILYGGALHDNVVSLKLADKVGFKIVAEIDLVKIFGKKSWHYSKEWK